MNNNQKYASYLKKKKIKTTTENMQVIDPKKQVIGQKIEVID